jgi:signal transduction histidine kinase
VCTVVITGSTAGSVADLLAAIRQIRAGDLRARVLISSQDEFGLLAASFNEMTDDLQRSQARIVASADAARRRVERDLHDGAQQQLVLVKLKLGRLRHKIRRDPSAAEGLAADLVDDLDRALAELRDLARGIYPALLETDGLRGALAEAASRAALPTTIDCDGATRYPREVEAAVYFCCLEALQNAAKHAGKDAKAAISLTADAAALRFEVSDDGAGFDAAVRGSSSGIQSMADRVGAHGGQLRVRSSPGHGTSVVGTIPLDS